MRTLLIALCAVAAPALAAEWPVTEFPDYEVFRQSMLDAGWQPVAQEVPYAEADGFPEVTCYVNHDEPCRAAWFDPDSRKVFEVFVLSVFYTTQEKPGPDDPELVLEIAGEWNIPGE